MGETRRTGTVTRFYVTRQELATWLGLPVDAELSLGLPCGAPVEGQEDVVLRVDTETPPPAPGVPPEKEPTT